MDTIIATEIPTVAGAPFAGGFFVGRINQADGVYALVAAPKAEGEHKPAIWRESSKRLAGALSFFDGLANTEAMATAGSELAKWARGLAIGGHSDWYLPARDELELIYRNLKPGTEENWCYRGDNPSSVPVSYAYFPESPAQTSVEAFRDGGAEALEEDWYWSSTQSAGYDAYAWGQGFNDGSQYYDHKDGEYRARAVRRVKIQ